ncbi:hypothetical protein KUTeg_007305 [Tegillarca granosa]|uniref:Uncharacterized protein n=1 Tax=Tegillarca granosa TaxID=220873 RepID=A0ABQ9FCV5_TEGGR|nr:hypothetical protein KUTeg_007305 [Tegillarca granosa]
MHFKNYMLKHLKNTDVTVTSVHPGNVKTEITRHLSSTNLYVLGTKLMYLLGLQKNPFQGAEPVINCVVNPNLKGVRDTYYIDCIETPVKTFAKLSQINYNRTFYGITLFNF